MRPGDAQPQRVSRADDPLFHGESDNPESYRHRCGLLHDLCKANLLQDRQFRNVKNDATGQWEKVPILQVAGRFPLRSRGKERLSHRAFHPSEARRGHRHPLAHGRLRRRGARRQLRHQQCLSTHTRWLSSCIWPTWRPPIWWKRAPAASTAAEPCCLMNPKRPRALVKGHAAFLLPQNMKTILKAVLSSGFLRPISVPAAPAAFPWAQGPRCGFFPGRFQTAPPSGCS